MLGPGTLSFVEKARWVDEQDAPGCLPRILASGIEDLILSGPAQDPKAKATTQGSAGDVPSKTAQVEHVCSSPSLARQTVTLTDSSHTLAHPHSPRAPSAASHALLSLRQGGPRLGLAIACSGQPFDIAEHMSNLDRMHA